jgi:hypothetical protein
VVDEVNVDVRKFTCFIYAKYTSESKAGWLQPCVGVGHDFIWKPHGDYWNLTPSPISSTFFRASASLSLVFCGISSVCPRPDIAPAFRFIADLRKVC